MKEVEDGILLGLHPFQKKTLPMQLCAVVLPNMANQILLKIRKDKPTVLCVSKKIT